jgi:hypothetical protein
MAKNNQAAPAATNKSPLPATDGAIPALSVRSVQESFCRAGRCWTQEVQVVALSEFTEEQVAALLGEKNLVVEAAALPAPTDGGN